MSEIFRFARSECDFIYNLKEGIILTINQSDLIFTDGYKIKVIPAYQFEIPL